MVETKPDYAGSIDPERVKRALGKLGHFSTKIVSPAFQLTKSRDNGMDPSCGLGYYRETEAIFNVIRENENLLHSHQHKDSYGKLSAVNTAS